MPESQSKNKGLLTTIFITVFIDMLGVGIIIPIIPATFFEEGTTLFSPGTSDATIGILYGILLASYPFMQLFGAPMLGALSDRYGRKPVLTVSLIGTMIGYLLFAYALLTSKLWLLFVSRMIPGFTGGNIAVIYSSIADISDEKTRAQNFGLVGMAFGLGFILGPTLGGLLGDETVVSWFSHDTPFWFTAALTLINIILVRSIFVETLASPNVSTISPWTGINNILTSFKRPNLRSVFSVILLMSLGFTFYTQFFAVYLIQEFSFTEKDIGLLYGWIGIWLALTQGFLVRKLAHVSPYKIVRYALLALPFSIIILLVPQEAKWFYALTPLIALAYGMLSPNLLTVVSLQASAQNQGEILGINQSMQSLGHVIPPLIAGYALSINGNLPLIGAGIFTMLAWLVYRWRF